MKPICMFVSTPDLPTVPLRSYSAAVILHYASRLHSNG